MKYDRMIFAENKKPWGWYCIKFILAVWLAAAVMKAFV